MCCVHGTSSDKLGAMLLELAIIVALVLVNGLFAGAEIAVVGTDRARLRLLVEAGGKRARAVSALRADPERFFATVQIVITIVGATAGAFGGATFARDLSPLLVPIFGRSAEEVALATVIAIVSYLSLVLGELVPKSLALRMSERYALAVAPLLVRLATVARPLVWLLTKSSNTVLRAFGDSTTFSESRLSPNELKELVDEAADVGTLDPRVGELATRAFDFAELTAFDVMVPRTQVVGIPRHASPERIREIVLEMPHSRLPVYENDLDGVVGYVLYKDLLPLAWEGRLLVLDDLIRPPFYAVENMPAVQLLHQMRERRIHLAFVVDERGGVGGIVTLDDLVEELVGEVFGELHASTPSTIRPQADGSAVVQGDAAIRDVNRELEIELPDGPGFSTVAGLCMSLAGGVPKAGDVLTVEGVELRIESASERAILRVRVTPNAQRERSL